MYDLKIYSSYIVAAIKDKIVFFSTDGAVLHTITVEQKAPAKDTDAANEPNGNQTQPTPANVVTFEYCPTAKVLAVSLSDKTWRRYQLREEDGGKLCSAPLGEDITTARTIVSMKFVPKHGVLFGTDKSDCFEFGALDKTSEPQPKWILGHMSQILALAVSDDERFIVTSDRDEKIKVSAYPDCHNIECFCLGHTEYVGGIEIIPSEKLISVSGDRTLRLWDVTEGKELCKLSLKEPALDFTVQKVAEGSGMLCAVRSYVQNMVEVALVSYDKPGASELYDPLTIDESLIILNAGLSGSLRLMLLTMEKESKRVRMLVYEFCAEKRAFKACDDHPFVKNFEDQFKDVTIEQVRDYSTLFKHTIDNLTEYFERKKIKMESKKSK
ncbi:tRNA (guanine-N(7)-)-methyltransferase non-catalytic subunit wuho [Anopheles gambiae]|uniref:tRNA (guanine-N(7)-)-methyltransferase non-catalytic subunit wuho n=1 Tax=Anopheles gambiae TaxID=7165 RepID=UPI002AC8B031|nr:tRNA (guanine-N(7)-)-methyltransferase non-catalytic subunit wuho [Anopheles gambiae]